MNIKLRRRGAIYLTISLIVIGITGCGSKNDKPVPEKSWFDEVQGVWAQQGYGNIMVFDQKSYSLYQTTNLSCLQIGTWPIQDLESSLNDKSKNTAANHITFEFKNNFTIQRFDRLSTLPSLCDNGGTSFTNDPELNFEILWNSFNEQYAFFERRGIDWSEKYGEFKGRINGSTSQQELFEIFSELLEEIDDSHVRLSSSDLSFQAGAPSMLLQRIYQEFTNQSEHDSLENYISEQLAIIDSILISYLNGQVRVEANQKIAWGLLSESIGYLLIKEMTGFSMDSNDEANLDVLSEVIFSAMKDLENTQALVIDLRLNGGGQANAALIIAEHFVSQNTPAFTIKARHNDSYTESQVVSLRPFSESGYSGEVIILTSGVTASAAEILVMSMLERGQVTLIGETTEGVFSNELQRQLANGWTFTLSNEVYETIAGVSLEGVGIIPDISQEIFPKNDREEGIDTGLDRAVSVLNEKGIY